MSRIRIDTDTLQNYVGALNGRISEFETLNARLVALNDQVLASWKGDAKLAFEKMMLDYIQQTEALVDIMTQFRNYAQDTADRFAALDAECAQRIRSSF